MPTLGKPYVPKVQASGLPQYLRPKQKFDAGILMKKAHWNAIIPQKTTENSFWAKCREHELASEDIFAGLTAKFSSKEISEVRNPSSTKKDVGLMIINMKSAQNVLILLRTLLKKTPHEQLKQSILRCDMDILTSDLTQQLIQCLPPPDQIERLKEMNNAGKKLTESEKFISTLGEIEGLLPRLHSIIFRFSIADMIQSIKTNASDAIAACEEVRTSKKFAKILELVLLFGNYMNSNSTYGQAYGFEMSFLTKMGDTKDVNNKQTLLHYLVETIEGKFPDSLNFHEELQHTKKAACISMENVREIMAEMTASFENLESSLATCKDSHSPDDKFVEVMADFAVECKNQMNALMKTISKMENSYKVVGEYFTFDTLKCSMEEFFSDVKMFEESFRQAYEEIKDARESQKEEGKALDFRKKLLGHQQKLPLIQNKADQSEKYLLGRCRDFKIKLNRISDSGTYAVFWYSSFWIPFYEILNFLYEYFQKSKRTRK